MENFWGFRGVALIVGAFLIGVSLPAGSSFESFNSPFQSLPADSQAGEQIMVCINWETKEVRHSKHWTVCPNKHQHVMLGMSGPKGDPGHAGPTGPRGPAGFQGSSGSTTSLWDSLQDCWAKYTVARNSGYFFAVKREREEFESASGCVVEEIRDKRTFRALSDAGLPFVSSFEILSVGPVTEGEVLNGQNSTLDTVAGGAATIKVKIENHLWISNFGTDSWGRKAAWCTLGTSQRNVTYIGNGEYLINASLRAELMSLTLATSLGYLWNNECLEAIYLNDALTLALDVDPEILIALDDATYNVYLVRWGWK